MIKRWQLKRNVVRLSTAMPGGYFNPDRQHSRLGLPLTHPIWTGPETRFVLTKR